MGGVGGAGQRGRGVRGGEWQESGDSGGADGISKTKGGWAWGGRGMRREGRAWNPACVGTEPGDGAKEGYWKEEVGVAPPPKEVEVGVPPSGESP